MADNAPRFIARRQKVLNQIVAFPETHDQTQWETGSPSCGTQRCVAGWAIHFEKPDIADLDRAKYAVASELRVAPRYFTVGRDLLGLTDAEAYELFYEVTNPEAIELLRQYATGSTAVVHTEYYEPDYSDEG